MKLQEVVAIGLEARVVPDATRVVRGESVRVPEHWLGLAMFAGRSGPRPKMFSTLFGVEQHAGFDAAKRLLGRGLEHFPVDGRDILLDGSSVVSATDPALKSKVREWTPRVPPRDVLQTSPDAVVEGRVVGAGIGVEMQGRKLYVLPYTSVLVYEYDETGAASCVTVHARHFSPFHPSTLLEEPLRDCLGEFFRVLRKNTPIGGFATVQYCTGKGRPHFMLGDVYNDTLLGHRMAEAGVKPLDLSP